MISSYVQLILIILITASLYTIISSSFYFIYTSTKFFHLAHAAIISAGAYLTLLFSEYMYIPLWISIPLAVSLAALLGLLCELIVYKPMRQRSSPIFTYLVASIGIYTILQNCIYLYFGDDAKTINLGPVKEGNNIFGAYITTIQIITIIISLALFVSTILLIRFSALGKSIRAVSSNPALCDIYGISSDKVIAWCFVIGSALGAVAGILSGMDTNFTPTMGFDLLLYGVVVMIIGGIGSYRGLVAGAFLIATSQHLITFYVDKKWMDTVVYIILILFLIWKPLGFSGLRLKKVEI
jgi:branched-chain amino acid transport system permease protein